MASFSPLGLSQELRARVPGWAVGQEATSQGMSAAATALEGAALTADPLPSGAARRTTGSSSSPCTNSWLSFPLQGSLLAGCSGLGLAAWVGWI